MAQEPAGMNNIVLQPGQSIRPIMTEVTAAKLVESLYGLKVSSIKELNSYDDKNYKVNVENTHTNPHIGKKLWRHGYILKVLNSMDTPKRHVEDEHAAQKLLWDTGIWCPQPVPNLEGRESSTQTIIYETGSEENGSDGESGKPQGRHRVRLLTFIPGEIIASVTCTPDLLQEAGTYLGRLQNALRGLKHISLDGHETIWDVKHTPRLVHFLHAVKEPNRVAIVREVLEAFSENVLSNYHLLKQGVIHGDYNEQNLLIGQRVRGWSEDGAPQKQGDEVVVSGVIDFGDMVHSCYVFEVGAAIMYMGVNPSFTEDPLLAGGYMLAGYLHEMGLNSTEWSVLRECVAARYCQSLVMGAYSYEQDPSNEYLLSTSMRGWSQLERLWKTPSEELYALWRRIIKERSPDVRLPPI